jgi:hypothetical protein
VVIWTISITSQAKDWGRRICSAENNSVHEALKVGETWLVLVVHRCLQIMRNDCVPIIRRNNCICVTLGTCYSVWMTVWYASIQNNKYQVSHKYSCFSWWWAHSRPKHVEKRNKHTKKSCAPIWLYVQGQQNIKFNMYVVWNAPFSSWSYIAWPCSWGLCVRWVYTCKI